MLYVFSHTKSTLRLPSSDDRNAENGSSQADSVLTELLADCGTIFHRSTAQYMHTEPIVFVRTEHIQT